MKATTYSMHQGTRLHAAVSDHQFAILKAAREGDDRLPQPILLNEGSRLEGV